MKLLIIKYLLTATIIVVVSEIAKRLDRLGALISSLPLVTVMVLIWLYVEKQPESKIANHAWYTFWYVIPTLPMFAAFPFLLTRFGFIPALAMSIVITFVSFILTALLAKKFGVILF